MPSQAGSLTHERERSILIVGASRGIGHAMASEFLGRGWSVVGTVRGSAPQPLHELAARHKGRLRIERLDIDDAESIAALRHQLGGIELDILFVNAGTTTEDEHVLIGDVSTEEFARVMGTNTLGPMRVVEALHHLVRQNGLIGAMSSGQGSVTNNETGGREVYRASKAALNMLMRSFAARTTAPNRTTLLLAPGWIRTALGGPDATFSLEEAIPDVVTQLISHLGRGGTWYIDRFGKQIPY